MSQVYVPCEFCAMRARFLTLTPVVPHAKVLPIAAVLRVMVTTTVGVIQYDRARARVSVCLRLAGGHLTAFTVAHLTEVPRMFGGVTGEKRHYCAAFYRGRRTSRNGKYRQLSANRLTRGLLARHYISA